MHVSKLEKEELLQKAFRALDRDGSGAISLEELADALKRFGIYDDAKELLASADANQVRRRVGGGRGALAGGRGGRWGVWRRRRCSCHSRDPST